LKRRTTFTIILTTSFSLILQIIRLGIEDELISFLLLIAGSVLIGISLGIGLKVVANHENNKDDSSRAVERSHELEEK